MNIKDQFLSGAIIQIDKKLYARCLDCGKIVHINKMFFGSLHACLTTEERLMRKM